jgi:hypothetical protein
LIEINWQPVGQPTMPSEVVGVGSVGTLALSPLLIAEAGDPLDGITCRDLFTEEILPQLPRCVEDSLRDIGRRRKQRRW